MLPLVRLGMRSRNIVDNESHLFVDVEFHCFVRSYHTAVGIVAPVIGR